MEPGKRKGKAAALEVQKKKLEFRENAKEKLGLILDTPDPAGYGGSSDTANSAREFLSYEKRWDVVDLWEVRSMYISARFRTFLVFIFVSFARLILMNNELIFTNASKTPM